MVYPVLRTIKHDRRATSKRVLAVLACLALTVYFAHHAVAGRHGFEARQRLLARAPHLEVQLSSLDLVRQRLQRDVDVLTSDFPSRDLVEEIARDMLGYVLPSEVVWIGR